MSAPLNILHCHSTFALGGKEARAVRLMNAWGPRARHTILSATDRFDARAAIDPRIDVAFPVDAPSLNGMPVIARYRRLSAYMRRFDLVLTYNWGSMDAVMARRLFGGAPLVHHEDGFNADEADGQKAKRVWFRRLGLGAASALVVPSFTLERIARDVWWQGRRVRRIANGVPVARYGSPQVDALPGLDKRPGEIVIGTIAGLRAVKALDRLIDAVAPLPEHVRLCIVGDGEERRALEARAAPLGRRVHFAGFQEQPWRFAGLFDVLALSSLSEQQPIAVIEGMAAGLPIVSTHVGDVREMVAPQNQRFIVACEAADVAEALGAALATIVADADLRAALGAANRARALADYDEGGMISAYAALYGRVAGRVHALDPAAF